jgi:hypothetical protein
LESADLKLEAATAFLALAIAAWLFFDPSWLVDVRLRAAGHVREAVVSSKARAPLAAGGQGALSILAAVGGKTFEIEVGEEAWRRMIPGQSVRVSIDDAGTRAILVDAPSMGARRFSIVVGLVLAALAAFCALRRPRPGREESGQG